MDGPEVKMVFGFDDDAIIEEARRTVRRILMPLLLFCLVLS
jgi:hypothetical protein